MESAASFIRVKISALPAFCSAAAATTDRVVITADGGRHALGCIGYGDAGYKGGTDDIRFAVPDRAGGGAAAMINSRTCSGGRTETGMACRAGTAGMIAARMLAISVRERRAVRSAFGGSCRSA